MNESFPSVIVSSFLIANLFGECFGEIVFLSCRKEHQGNLRFVCGLTTVSEQLLLKVISELLVVHSEKFLFDVTKNLPYKRALHFCALVKTLSHYPQRREHMTAAKVIVQAVL